MAFFSMDAFLERVPAPVRFPIPDYVSHYRRVEGRLGRLGEGVRQDDEDSRDLLGFIAARRAVNKREYEIWTAMEKIEEQLFANHARATEAGRAVQDEIARTAYRDIATGNALIRRVEEAVADFRTCKIILSRLSNDALAKLQQILVEADRLDTQGNAIVARRANRATRGGQRTGFFGLF